MGKAGGVGCGSLETVSRSSTMKRCRSTFSLQSDMFSLSLSLSDLLTCVTAKLITKHVVGLGLKEGVMKISINKQTFVGCKVKIWIADWFVQLNNKMGDDLKKIQTVG